MKFLTRCVPLFLIVTAGVLAALVTPALGLSSPDYEDAGTEGGLR